MLLELRQLSESLKEANVLVGQRDDHLVGYSKSKPVFRVTLGEQAEICSVRLVSKELVSRLEKYEVSKGGARESAPGFNVPPLRVPVGTENEKNATKEEITRFAKQLKNPMRGDTRELRTASLQQLVARCESGWEAKADAIGKCLGNAVDVLTQVLHRAEGINRDIVAPLVTLLDRAKLLTPAELRERLEAKVLAIATSEAGGEELLQLLFTKESVVLLELPESDGTPANHETVWDAVNRVLLDNRSTTLVENLDDSTSERHLDAFGKPYSPSEEKMPERKLPRLGNVKLRSHSASHRCQPRYGLSEDDSFPISLPARLPLASALRWLTHREREGKTYRDISGASGMIKREGGKPRPRETLLLAYPESCPEDPPELADLFAGMSGEADFTSLAARTVSQLDDLKTRGQAATISVFVLYRRDKGRVKLLFSRQLTADRISQSVRDWRDASTNLPPVFLPCDGDQPRWHRCDKVPFPSQLAKCLNTLWTWDRTKLEPKKVAVFNFGSTLALLLDDGPMLRDTATTALRNAISQWTQMLLELGQAISTRKECQFNPADHQLLPPILGLLLFKLGHRKEVYMKAMPYWLGRFLAVADEVHRNYCIRERDGVIPKGPLLGNSVISACLENPQAGYAELAYRVPPYQRVAGVELSTVWADIIQHLDVDNLPNRLSDEGKAQLLLGYLARPELLKPEPTTPSEAQS